MSLGSIVVEQVEGEEVVGSGPGAGRISGSGLPKP